MTKIIGIGPGDLDFLYPLAQKEIEKADVLIGGKRNLADFAHLHKETRIIGNNLKEIAAYIADNWEKKNIVVLASGDTGLFSIAKVLKEYLPQVDLTFYPGISSLQYLLAKKKMSWEEMKIISLHGKNCASLLNVIRHNAKVAVFTGGTNRPEVVAARIPWENLKITVGENLSYPEERIVSGSPKEIAALEFSSLSLMILEHDGKIEENWAYLSPGIPNEAFLRDKVPMTKEESRALILSKLRLTGKNRILEVGAGTGSVTVEMALMVQEGEIWAIEQNPQAAALCRQNFQKFHLDNIALIEGNAPEDIPPGIDFDRVFIGGSRGKMEAILAALPQRPLRTVISAIAVETVVEAKEALLRFGYDNIEIVSLTIAKNKIAGGKNLMMGENPTYIIVGERP